MEQLRRCLSQGAGEARMFEHDERYKFEAHEHPGFLKLEFSKYGAVVTGKAVADVDSVDDLAFEPYSVLEYRFVLDVNQLRESFSDLEGVQKIMQELSQSAAE
jgi:hypothetical protein